MIRRSRRIVEFEALPFVGGKKRSPSCRLGRKLNVNISFSDLSSYLRRSYEV